MAAQPTNGEILKEIKAQGAILQDHETRLRQWEQFKIAYDAADAAVSKYKQEHASTVAAADMQESLFNGGISKDFVNVVLKFLGILASLIAIISLVLQYILK